MSKIRTRASIVVSVHEMSYHNAKNVLNWVICVEKCDIFRSIEFTNVGSINRFK